ncbi:hypothetical protein KY313_02525 [Candidatus Woesearchaeota archaeon]|jgi:ribosomal protein S3AE|nr:hypothetical protein [Candidatus Woesearchaeota archaeon]
MAKVKKKVLKAKKKFWFQVIAPKMFGEQVIGESYVSDAQLMNGKHLTVNLRVLTDDIKNQNVKIGFVVNNVKENKAHCSIISYQLLPASIKRMISRGKVRADDFFVGRTSDNVNVRVKIVMVTINVTSNSVVTHMRKEARELLGQRVSKLTYEGLLQELIAHRLQFSLKKELKKVYPLRACEIRSLTLEGKKRVVEQEDEKGLQDSASQNKIEEKPEVEEKSVELDKKEEVKKEKKPENPAKKPKKTKKEDKK